MSAIHVVKYVFMYKPPKGKWYVHSHKLYDSAEEGILAAREFLSPGTPICLVPLYTEVLDDSAILVPER